MLSPGGTVGGLQRDGMTTLHPSSPTEALKSSSAWPVANSICLAHAIETERIVSKSTKPVPADRPPSRIQPSVSPCTNQADSAIACDRIAGAAGHALLLTTRNATSHKLPCDNARGRGDIRMTNRDNRMTNRSRGRCPPEAAMQACKSRL